MITRQEFDAKVAAIGANPETTNEAMWQAFKAAAEEIARLRAEVERLTGEVAVYRTESVEHWQRRAREAHGATMAERDAALDRAEAAERDLREMTLDRDRAVGAHQSALAREEAAEARVKVLAEALEFYADPETYHAVGFLIDPPDGGWSTDFDREHGHPDYDRAMPGKRARAALGKGESRG